MKNTLSLSTPSRSHIKTIIIDTIVSYENLTYNIVFEKVDIYHIVDSDKYPAINGFKCSVLYVKDKMAHIQVLGKSVSIPLSCISKVYKEHYKANYPNVDKIVPDTNNDPNYSSEIVRKTNISSMQAYSDLVDDNYYNSVKEGISELLRHPADKVA